MKRNRKLTRDKFERHATEVDWRSGAWFFVGMNIGCFVWAFMIDSAEFSSSAKWLGQGVAISVGILVALGLQTVLRHSPCDWKRVLRGPVTGVVIMLAVWGTAAIAAYWRGPKFSTGAWCAALGGFGFLAHKLQQRGTRVGLMAWVYGVFFVIGLVTMYVSTERAKKETAAHRHTTNTRRFVSTGPMSNIERNWLNSRFSNVRVVQERSTKRT